MKSVLVPSSHLDRRVTLSAQPIDARHNRSGSYSTSPQPPIPGPHLQRPHNRILPIPCSSCPSRPLTGIPRPRCLPASLPQTVRKHVVSTHSDLWLQHAKTRTQRCREKVHKDEMGMGWTSDRVDNWVFVDEPFDRGCVVAR